MARALGVDYGTKRVGLALSDASKLLATPLSVAGRDEAISAITKAVAEHDVDEIVVGMPNSLSGQDGPAAANASDFVAELRSAVEVDVLVEDERFTTAIAERSMIETGERRRDRRRKIDSAAAAIILQSYLDRR